MNRSALLVTVAGGLILAVLLAHIVFMTVPPAEPPGARYRRPQP